MRRPWFALPSFIFIIAGMLATSPVFAAERSDSAAEAGFVVRVGIFESGDTAVPDEWWRELQGAIDAVLREHGMQPTWQHRWNTDAPTDWYADDGDDGDAEIGPRIAIRVREFYRRVTPVLAADAARPNRPISATVAEFRVFVEIVTDGIFDGRRVERIQREAKGPTRAFVEMRVDFVGAIRDTVRRLFPPRGRFRSAVPSHRPESREFVELPATWRSGTVVRLAAPTTTGFGFVTRNEPGTVAELHVFSAPDFTAIDDASMVWIEKIDMLGASITATTGLLDFRHDAFAIDGFPVSATRGGASLGASFGVDFSAMIVDLPGVWLDLDYAFTQGGKIKANTVSLQLRVPFFAGQFAVAPIIGVGVSLGEISAVELTRIFGTGNSKARHTRFAITLALDVSLRLDPHLGLALRTGFRLTGPVGGANEFTAHAQTATVAGVNLDTGGWFVNVGPQIFF